MMMEVTPHLKTVLKNYQHSATKSLQGPGHQVLSIKEPSSPSLISNGSSSSSSAASSPIKDEPTLVQPTTQCCVPFPILTAADTSCSERTETVLESQTISCFLVGGERRLCLPQVLISVLGKFSLPEINQECDQLQIYCSRCTPDQLNVLKNHGILPSSAPSCGLITKTDAERLCSSLLLQNSHKTHTAPSIRKGSTAFAVYHRCFGKGRGLCIPELYTGRCARCIECQDCRGLFSPQQFVCHSHRDLENRTVHWGFDSAAWRAYLLVTKLDQQPPAAPADESQCAKYLDDMWERYEGRVAFPTPPPVSPSNGMAPGTVHHKRKLLTRTHQDLLNNIKSTSENPYVLANATDSSIPALKKNKLMDTNSSTVAATYAPLPTYPHMFQHMELNSYLNYMNIHHAGSAFNPIIRPMSLKETKLRQTIALNNMGYQPTANKPPVENGLTSNGTHSESNGGGFQPNIALTPATPKKYRYFNKSIGTVKTTIGPPTEIIKIEKEDSYQQQPIEEVSSSVMKDTVIKQEKPNDLPLLTNGIAAPQQHSPDSQSVIDSTVSVVQSTRSSLNRYNSEIELSTDTDDTCSEMSDRTTTLTSPSSIEEVLKGVQDVELRDRVISLVRRLKLDYDRELDERDLRLKDLQKQVADLQDKLGSVNLHNNNITMLPNDSEEIMEQDESTTSAVIEDTKDVDDDQEIGKIEPVKEDVDSSSSNKPGVITAAAVTDKVSIIETTDGDK